MLVYADRRYISDGLGTFRVLLDKTVFYPMGGGQPTDQGKLSSSDWSADVYQVMMRDGEIWHYVKSPAPPTTGTTIHIEINWDRRYKNMRVHSAGHIVDFAMYLLNLSPSPLMPFKGYTDTMLMLAREADLLLRPLQSHPRLQKEWEEIRSLLTESLNPKQI